MREVVTETVEGRPRVTVVVAHQVHELPALWLRERSPETDQRDAVTGQRLFDPHLLPVDLHLVAAESVGERLTVTFSDGHTSQYDHAELLASCVLSDDVPSPTAWRASSGQPRVHSWVAVRSEPAVELEALRDFLAYGAIVLDGVPTTPGTLIHVAEQFGFVRETNFGRLFDVRSIPDSTDLAYRAVPLSAHTDNPYRTPVPGIQLLHCLVNDTTGGLSTLVDGLAVAEQLASEDPSALALLATVAVRFRYLDADSDIVTVRPLVDLDHTGAVVGLNYSPRLDETPLMPADDARHYQAARQRLAVLLAGAEFEVRFKLDVGQLMMFDNNRVMHGRTEFDPREGARHLQGCYIDQDGPRTRFRVLSRRAAGETARAD